MSFLLDSNSNNECLSSRRHLPTKTCKAEIRPKDCPTFQSLTHILPGILDQHFRALTTVIVYDVPPIICMTKNGLVINHPSMTGLCINEWWVDPYNALLKGENLVHPCKQINTEIRQVSMSLYSI